MQEMGKSTDFELGKFVMPFDEKRMAFGGFKSVVEYKKK
jgi:uncharacterized protein YbaA (DUF1428 family)